MDDTEVMLDRMMGKVVVVFGDSLYPNPPGPGGRGTRDHGHIYRFTD